MNTLQRSVYIRIVVLVKDIDCRPNSPRQNHRVLRDDGDSASEVGETNMGDVDAVNDDSSSCSFDEAEETECEGTFPRSSLANHSDFFLGFDVEVEAV